jgi:hypothetical protein
MSSTGLLNAGNGSGDSPFAKIALSTLQASSKNLSFLRGDYLTATNDQFFDR